MYYFFTLCDNLLLLFIYFIILSYILYLKIIKKTFFLNSLYKNYDLMYFYMIMYLCICRMCVYYIKINTT